MYVNTIEIIPTCVWSHTIAAVECLGVYVDGFRVSRNVVGLPKYSDDLEVRYRHEQKWQSVEKHYLEHVERHLSMVGPGGHALCEVHHVHLQLSLHNRQQYQFRDVWNTCNQRCQGLECVSLPPGLVTLYHTLHDQRIYTENLYSNLMSNDSVETGYHSRLLTYYLINQNAFITPKRNYS